MAEPGDILVIARPQEITLRAMAESVAPLNLQKKNGGSLFPWRNTHQSLSCIHPPSRRDAMWRAASAVMARAFAMQLDVVRSMGVVPGSIHWQFIASGKVPDGFAKLQTGLLSSFAREGVQDNLRHGPHVTLNYFALQPIEKVWVRPVTWIIDTIELVEARGRGRDYRYETLDAWKLQPMTEPVIQQLDLLA